jgi:diadenosine tetraphosphate (Ap4A) HIT family hydrolase
MKPILDEKFEPDGYNIGVNIGRTAGQSIPHVHIHMIPRYRGDVEDPRGGVRGVIPHKRKYAKHKGKFVKHTVGA